MDPVSIAAVGWGISTAGWLVSPIFSKVINKCISYLGFRSSDKLKNLESQILQLKLMLETAEASTQRSSLEQWVRKLKSAFYEAEDILDDIDYHRLKSRVLYQSTNRTEQDVETTMNFNVPVESRKELKEILEKFEVLINEGDKLVSLLKLPCNYGSISNTPNNIVRLPNKSTSAPPEVFGRDGDLKMIRSMVHDTPAAKGEPSTSRTKSYSVIGIHGIPGSGKTTLAQHVCAKEKEDGYFNPIMWIHVSQNFSVDTIFNEMLEFASGGKKGQYSNLDLLQRELEKELRGKRFFLVLDDVWYDKGVSEQQLDLLLSPLKAGKTGSKILVTTRTAEAAKALGAQNLVPIPDLDEEQYFLMFMHYALDGAIISDPALLREHKLIGRKIAGKLGASPLAARTVAGQLRRRLDTEFWKRTLNRDLLKDPMGPLWWSYQQLEDHIRQCFTYCCMFPRRKKLKIEDLVHLWMAQGFVETTNGTEDIEDVGHNYFDNLLSCSFIQPNEKDAFTIHDLFHDIAERVAGSDFFRIEKGVVGKLPQDVRHLFITSYDRRVFTEQVPNLRSLRTIFLPHTQEEISETDLHLVMKLKKLRVVSLGLGWMEKVSCFPECIGELKHLRYLSVDVAKDHLITVPATFAKLYHLQTLTGFGYQFDFSPVSKMCNLENLRHLSINSGLEFPDVGRLRFLRSLTDFTVRETRGYEIHQLEHLDNLHGTLRIIEGLENVRSTEEARQANLANKVHLSGLQLSWAMQNQDDRKSKKQRTSYGQSPHLQEKVLEALRPPSMLKSLYVATYSGSTYPSWFLKEQGTLENLQDLTLISCPGLNDPPKINKVFMHLRTLDVKGTSCHSLPENMTSLEKLVIYSCKNIRSLPRLLPSLKNLEIGVWNGSVAPPEITKSMVNLQVLKVVNCSWRSLPRNMQSLSSLEELVISNCRNIRSLPMVLPQSLKKLKLGRWNGFEAPPKIRKSLVNLRKLSISSCSFNCFPENVECLTMLKELKIKNCENIHSLPRLPLSLKEIRLPHCNSSLMESCRQDPDLFKIVDPKDYGRLETSSEEE